VLAQRVFGRAGELKRRQRAIILEISAVDHRALAAAEVALGRDIGEARAVVGGRARAHVAADFMQFVEAVEKDVPLDEHLPGDDPPAALLMRGVQEEDRPPGAVNRAVCGERR
jgi:hypothetical protein